MRRFPSAVTAACLAALLLAAVPAPGWASRSAEQASAVGAVDPASEGLVGSVMAWGRGAVAWLQALIAAEHGNIVPLTPPPPPPSDTDSDPAP